MSKESSKLVDKAIREILAPVLRADSFKGSGRTFRRYRGELVHVLHVQGSQWGGQLYVNLGVHLRFLARTEDAPLAWERIREDECFLRQRLSEAGPDRNWRHDGEEPSIVAAIQSILSVYQSDGRGEFARFDRFPDSFAGIPHDTAMLAPTSLGKFEASRAALNFETIQLRIVQLREAPETPGPP